MSLRIPLALLLCAIFLTGPGLIQADASQVPGAIQIPIPHRSLLRAATETAAAETTIMGSVTGEVFNGTTSQPAGSLEITLSAFTEDELAFALATESDSSGLFMFEQVEIDPGLVYLASTEFDGVLYSSIPAQAAEGQDSLFLQLLVYESSAGIDPLMVSRLHLAFDFLEPGKIRVGELWVLANQDNRTILPLAGLAVTLPDGFHDLEADPSMSSGMTVIDSGFTIERPFLPGQDAGSLMFSYSLPYARSLEFLRTFPLPLQSGTVLLPASNLVLSGDTITTSSTIRLSGTDVLAYSLDALPAGETLQLKLTGRAPGAGLLQPSDPVSLAAGAGLLLLAVLFAWQTVTEARRKERREAPGSFEEAVRQIAELDRNFESGKVHQRTYLEQRMELKQHARRMDGDNHDQG